MQNDVSHGISRITSFWHWKIVTNKCKRIETLQLLHDFFSAMGDSWKKLKTSNVVSSFIVCSNLNRSALVCELLGYNSLFVGQLNKDAHS